MSVQFDRDHTIHESTPHHTAKLEGRQVMTGGGLGSTGAKSCSHVPEAVKFITTVEPSSLKSRHISESP